MHICQLCINETGKKQVKLILHCEISDIKIVKMYEIEKMGFDDKHINLIILYSKHIQLVSTITDI